MPEARQQLIFDFARLLTKPAPAEKKTPPNQRDHTETNTSTKTLPAIRGRVLDVALTRQCREMVTALGLDALAKHVRVYWHSRLTTTAGLAHYNDATIDLNPELRKFAPEEPDRTMRHELAHLVAQFRVGNRRIQAHGSQWQQACTDLGIPGEKRCHDLPFQRRRVKRKYAYQCKHCQLVVPRVKKLARHSACYTCCKDHNRGRYSSKYLLLEIPLDEAKLRAPDAGW